MPVRPARATEFSGLSLMQVVVGAAIQPSTTWTHVPGVTQLTRGSREYEHAEWWRIRDVVGGWSLFRFMCTFSLDEDEEVDFGFSISGANPTGIFASKTPVLIASSPTAEHLRLEAWLSLSPGQYVEPWAKVDGSATASLEILAGTFHAMRGQNP